MRPLLLRGLLSVIGWGGGDTCMALDSLIPCEMTQLSRSGVAAQQGAGGEDGGA